VENSWFRFVALLDFAGDFEDEDADEDEEDGGSGRFSHRLSTPLAITNPSGRHVPAGFVALPMPACIGAPSP
jgi:hypothetical protein